MPEKKKTLPFKPESYMDIRMAEGHLVRKGHDLKGHWEEDKEGEFFQTFVRDCCKD